MAEPPRIDSALRSHRWSRPLLDPTQSPRLGVGRFFATPAVEGTDA